MAATQGDPRLTHSLDGGDLSLVRGVVELDGGLATAVYLSMFGGNFDDDGQRTSRSWWGNADEPDTARHYRGETEYVIRTLSPAISALRRVEDAMERDLGWMISSKIASELTPSADVVEVDKIRLSVRLRAQGEEIELRFTENWKASIG